MTTKAGSEKDGSISQGDPNMARAAKLQREWATVKEELDEAGEDSERRVALGKRMEVITSEMAGVLSRAQEKLPPDDLTAGDDLDTPVLSLNARHRVERTYDSSDSDGPPSSRLKEKPRSSRVVVDASNSPAARVRNDRTVLTTLGTKLRSTLRRADSKGYSLPTSAQREELKDEEARLEKELRTLKRAGTNANKQRITEIAARLKEITDLSLDNTPDTQDDGPPSNSFAAKAVRAFADVTRSPRRRATTDETDADGPKNDRKLGGKRKGWGNLRKVLTQGSKIGKGSAASAAASEKEVKAAKGNSQSPASVIARGGDGTEFAEARDRLEQRGEKLSTLANDSVAMREGANDFLSAARALREKKSKKGLF